MADGCITPLLFIRREPLLFMLMCSIRCYDSMAILLTMSQECIGVCVHNALDWAHIFHSILWIFESLHFRLLIVDITLTNIEQNGRFQLNDAAQFKLKNVL